MVRLSGEHGEHRAEHWAKVVQAACEQSGRSRGPRLLPVATMDEWLSGVVPGLKLLLICKEGACRLSELAPDPSVTFLIGPEGGFAAERRVPPSGPGTERYGSARGSCAPTDLPVAHISKLLKDKNKM